MASYDVKPWDFCNKTMQLFYKMIFFFHFTYIIDLKTKIKENSLLSMSMQSVLSSKCLFELTLFSRLHFCQNSSYLQIVQYAHGFVTQDYLFFIVFYSFVFEFGVLGFGVFYYKWKLHKTKIFNASYTV